MERNINCKTLPVQRSVGQSAVAAAAYRAAERLHDERQDKRHNFTNRQRDVAGAVILAPADAPGWVQDRAALWNHAEAAEKRKDGRPARDLELGLAWELPEPLQREAVIAFARREFVDKGYVVDIAFHRYGQRVTDATEKGRETLRRWAGHGVPFLERDQCKGLATPHVKIERNKFGNVTGYKIYQPHSHVLIASRRIEGEGFATKKDRWLDKHETAMNWRYEWPKLQNAYLEQIGSDVRVRAVAAEDRGDDAYLPVKSESMSREAVAMERRGEEPEEARRVDLRQAHNDAIRRTHRERKAKQERAPGEHHRLRVVRWWKHSLAALPERFGRLRERASKYLDRITDRGGGVDQER